MLHSALLLVGAMCAASAAPAQAAPAPCRFAIAPAGVTVPSVAGSSTFTLTTAAGCKWKASVDASFLTASPTSGSGSATISVTYAENTAAARTGRVSIKGASFALSQSAAVVEPPPPPPNEPPVADAGLPQVVPGGSLVTLIGAGSDPEGQPLTYRWTQISGPAASLSAADAAQPFFSAPAAVSEAQALTFTLVVNDGTQDSAPASTTVTVTAATPVDDPPTADAGAPQTVEGGSSVTLSGSGSDPEGRPMTYAWTQTAGPSVELSDAGAAAPGFTAPPATSETQVLTFALIVSDGTQDSAPAMTAVTVSAEAPDAATLLSDAAGIAEAFRSPGHYTIAPGTYVGNFVIAASDITVDATNVRFEPENRYVATLSILGSRVHVTGLTVANGAPDRDTINVGANTITTIADLPSDVTLDRVTAEAGASGGHRGFGLHGVNVTLVDCRATGFWEVGRDSQAIWINNGPGPYTILGGYFEGSGENLMVGGALPGILDPSGIPSDITVRGAHFFKPLAWKLKPGSVKNLFELKAGKRVVVENCLFENNWKDAQAGSAILIKADNQGGTPWMETSDVVFRNNVVRNSPTTYVVNIRGAYPANPAVRVRNVVFEHNLFDGVTSGIQAGEGVDGLRVDHNTFYKITGTFLFFYGGLLPDGTIFKTDLAFTGNVLHEGAYAVKGDGTAAGVATLTKYANVLDFTGNVIERVNHVYIYPAGNTIVAPGTLDAVLDPVTRKYPGEAGY